MRFGIVIMAAGKGTRLKSRRPKVLHEIGGKSLLSHVIAAAAQIVPAEDILVIVGHQADKVEAAVRASGVRFVLQQEQRGTGHAVQCAQDAVTGYDHILVLSGDVPLLRPETIRQVRDFHLDQQAAMTILTAVPADPTGYGRVVRRAPGSPEVAVIVEQKALTPEQQTTPEINSGIYAFRTQPLFRHICELSTNNAHGEYYLTDMAALLSRSGERVLATQAPEVIEVLGANTITEMMELDAALRLRTARSLLEQGVTIFRPETTVIDADVQVGADTIIEPFVQLLGRTVIGEACRIRSYSVLENATVGDGVLIRQGCILSDAQVGVGALIGPYSHLRPGSEIGAAAHVGNFVETKKIRLGRGSKANHLTYLGDAEIGTGVNVGAGVITCNYDGVNKHKTVIGDRAFIGSDSTLVAPIAIGEGAYVAAGSCLTENVPAEALALGRARQAIKPEWAKRKKKGC